jgi:hypothetical protein
MRILLAGLLIGTTYGAVATKTAINGTIWRIAGRAAS